MLLPDRPSALRRLLLAPFTLAYVLGTASHRAIWLQPRWRSRAGFPPLIVIGSLRAGGAGKTAVTLELARALRAEGRRVGILAYRIHAGDRKGGATEVFPDTDWRSCSDEAVLLARESNARVFVTRDRERAWAELARAGGFDVLLADDGLMDSRLDGAFRTVLSGPDENPGWADLLPAGPYRFTAARLKNFDATLREGAGFFRKPVMPPEWEPDRAYWVLCGLGNPPSFLRALRGAGVRIAGFSAGPDHGLPNLERASLGARRAGTEHFLCSGKDWVKLERHPARPTRLLRVGEDVRLSRSFVDAALDKAPTVAPTS